MDYLNDDDSKELLNINSWLSSENWPMPGWYTNNERPSSISSDGYLNFLLQHLRGKRPSSSSDDDYRNFFLQDLRGKYILLESDFRTILPVYIAEPKLLDLGSSEIIFEHLQAARENLEQNYLFENDLIMMVNELDFIDRSLFWIYPAHLLKPKIASLKLKLEKLKPLGWEYYQAELDRKMKKYIPEECSIDIEKFSSDKLYSIRSILDETTGACNKQLLDEHINAGLQIKRLLEIRKWGLIMLFTFLAFSSFIVNSEFLDTWRYIIFPENLYIMSFLLAVSIAFFGASGGFLSGLMYIRGSTTNLSKYRESLIRTQLKPIVGAFAALLIYVFISYKIISGIDLGNLGAILLAAFISGFSERFFLRLIDVKIEEEEKLIETDRTPEKVESIFPKRADKNNSDNW